MKTIKIQKGFSLVELTVVIVIIFGLVAFGLSSAPKLFSDLNSVGELTELPKIIMNIKRTAKNDPTYSGLTVDTLARSNVFPENRATIPASGTATASNQWGGAVTLTIGTLNSANDIARLVSSGIPKSECVEIVNGMGKMLRRVYVDSSNSGTAGGGTIVKQDGEQVSTSAVATACGATNSITYDIGKS